MLDGLSKKPSNCPKNSKRNSVFYVEEQELARRRAWIVRAVKTPDVACAAWGWMLEAHFRSWRTFLQQVRRHSRISWLLHVCNFCIAMWSSNCVFRNGLRQIRWIGIFPALETALQTWWRYSCGRYNMQFLLMPTFTCRTQGHACRGLSRRTQPGPPALKVTAWSRSSTGCRGAPDWQKLAKRRDQVVRTYQCSFRMLFPSALFPKPFRAKVQKSCQAHSCRGNRLHSPLGFEGGFPIRIGLVVSCVVDCKFCWLDC